MAGCCAEPARLGWGRPVPQQSVPRAGLRHSRLLEAQPGSPDLILLPAPRASRVPVGGISSAVSWADRDDDLSWAWHLGAPYSSHPGEGPPLPLDG